MAAQLDIHTVSTYLAKFLSATKQQIWTETIIKLKNSCHSAVWVEDAPAVTVSCIRIIVVDPA